MVQGTNGSTWLGRVLTPVGILALGGLMVAANVGAPEQDVGLARGSVDGAVEESAR